MSTVLIALHIVVCIALIIIVLLQMGKGAEAGASFGAGSSQTMFGASGASSFMGKVTAGAAIVFMLTSLSLAYFYSSPAAKSVMPSTVAPASTPAPTPTAAPAPAPTPAPTAPAEKSK